MTSASDDLRGTASLGVRARTTLCAAVLAGGLVAVGTGPASAATEQAPEESPTPTTAIDAGQQDDADQEDGEDQLEQDVPEESDSTESGETEQSTDSASQSPELAPSEDITQEPAPSDPSQEAEEPSAPDTPSDLEDQQDGEPSPEPAPTPDEDGSADDGSAAPGTPEEPQGPEPEPNDPEASSLDCRSTASPGETVSIRVLGADSLQLGNGATGVLGGTAEAAGDTVTYTAPHSDTGVDSFPIVDASGASELCQITVSGSFEELDSGDSADEPDPSSTPTGEPEYGVPGMPSTSAGSAAESQDPSDSSEEERQSGSDNSSPESPSQNDEASQDEDDSQDAEQESSDDEDLAETGMDSASTLAALFLALGALLSGVAALMVARRRV